MIFVLSGFRQVRTARVFAFEGIGEDRSREAFTVAADLALAQRYGIRLQELPLLCKEVLNRPENNRAQREFSFTEEDMRNVNQAAIARAEAAKPRKPPRRPAPGSQVGAGWRGQQQQQIRSHSGE